MLHPQARFLLDLMVERKIPPTHTLTPAEARKSPTLGCVDTMPSVPIGASPESARRYCRSPLRL